MRAEELWKAYCEKENIDIDTPYEAWGFGDAPDQLADLVLTGIKTATASAYDLYFMEGEEDPLPQSGDYSVILNSKDEAVCVIQTTKTTVVPFDEVSRNTLTRKGKETEVLHTGEMFMKISLQKNLQKQSLNSMDKQVFFVRNLK